MSGDHLDTSSEIPRPHPAPSRTGKNAAGRKFLGIHFTCCDVYGRIYINRRETAYHGHCPRCGKSLLLRIGPGGTDQRFFTAW